MFSSYLKIAWRNLIKDKVYSFINFLGLTIGLTCFILIALYIQFELSYDKHHEKADRIFRVAQQQIGNDYRGTDLFALAPLPLGVALQADFPEVQAATNLNERWALLVSGNDSYSEKGIVTDQNIFDVFTIPVLEGEGKEGLSDPDAILLTQSLAQKIFGDKSPIGKSVIFERQKTLTVRGVIADPPKNQHLSYDFLASYKLNKYYPNDIGNWVSNNYHTYIVLAEGHDYKLLTEKMSVYNKLARAAYESEALNFYPKYLLQPLEAIHLYSNMNMEIGTNGDIKYVMLFAIIALIILILASINYMNLATAKSAKRAKEVGVNKVLGARKRHLTFQFLGESLLFTIFSSLLAVGLVIFLLPAYNELLGKEISFNLLTNGVILIGMLFFAFLISTLSGLYPAIYLSKIPPVKALKGNFLKSHKEGAFLRNSLVVGQFIAAIGLAIGSIIIHQQLDFIQHKKLGYTRDQIVHVPYWEKEIGDKEALIRSELLNHPKISKVSISNQLPLNLSSQGIVNEWEGNFTNEELWIYRSYVDYDFLDLFEMELLEGRNFSRDFATDSSEAYILNESAIKKLGWKTSVGKKFNDGKVIGVVRDFHLQTFDLPIEPLFMTMRNRPQLREYGQVIIKVDPIDFDSTKAFIENTMKSIVPLAYYEVRFVEDSFAQLYIEEQRLGKAFNVFALLALFISGIGLFGLVSFHVVQRTKEIGIRKVLGSSVTGIVSLITGEYLKLVIIALIIAVPISSIVMTNWLEEYAYKIDIHWWVYVFVGLGAMAVALITISFQSIKAALANPVKCLRTE